MSNIMVACMGQSSVSSNDGASSASGGAEGADAAAAPLVALLLPTSPKSIALSEYQRVEQDAQYSIDVSLPGHLLLQLRVDDFVHRTFCLPVTFFNNQAYCVFDGDIFVVSALATFSFDLLILDMCQLEGPRLGVWFRPEQIRQRRQCSPGSDTYGIFCLPLLPRLSFTHKKITPRNACTITQ